MENLLLFVAVAACPLMMWLMMRAMRGKEDHQEGRAPEDRLKATRLKDEVARLREEVARRGAEEDVPDRSSDKRIG